MADRMQYLEEFADLVGRLNSGGFSRREIQEMLDAVIEHLAGGGERPYAMGRCSNCGAVQVAWSEYQWAQLVRVNCRACGKPW